MTKIRTRIAPSPTGYVHIGTMHNALFAHALAKHNHGDFILRIEDTDRKRFVEGAAEELYKMLDEFGLTPDEGPEQGGPYEPYIQSERVSSGIYMQKAQELVSKGYAYYCFLTEEELSEIKMREEYKNKAFRSPYRDLTTEEAEQRISQGEEYVIRLKVPNSEEIVVDDAILGTVKWNSNDIDDQVLIKSDGFPTYHLAVVIDDNDMKITHVTRSYEWLPSTPKQILLYKYLGYDMPVFAHSSLILDPEGGKLSKRKGTVSVKQFLVEGYLVDAIKNFLMLLGWAPPVERVHGEKEREIFSHEEFIAMYALKERQKTNAVFNREKLLWFNSQYIKNKPVEELAEIFIKWMEQYAENKLLLKFIKEDKKLADKLVLIRERTRTLVEISETLQFFYIAPEKLNLNIKQLKTIPNIQNVAQDVLNLIEKMEADTSRWSNEEWAAQMKIFSSKYGLKPGDSFMVLRVAVVNSPFSPPLFEAMQILGKEEVIKRLKRLINQDR